MCSYLGTFPPPLARAFIGALSDPGDIVLDPFSGRGTTLLEARLLGRFPLASDVNPIAVALSAAKNVYVEHLDVLERLDDLMHRFDSVLYLPEARVQPEDIQLIYNSNTLAELCYLRRRLANSDKAVDQFLAGTVLGIMHGSERKDNSSGYASIDMPNTFSMSPNYVRRFVERKLSRPYRNVFEVIRGKLVRLFESGAVTKPGGIVEWCDVRGISMNAKFAPFIGQIRLVVTSPPYLDVINYAKQNWIRNWFMANHPNYHLFESLDDELVLDRWLKFADEAVLEMKKMLAPGGVIALVLGDVALGSRGFISLAREFIQRVLHEKTFHYVGCFDDEIREGVKTTRIWGETKGRATETDRIVILSDRCPTFHFSRLSDLFGPEAKFEAEDLIRFNAAALAEHARSFSGVDSNKASK
jgi:hypothetical protein